MALDNITRVDTMRTMFINLKPAAIFGVIELVAGIGEAWSYIDREFLGGSEIGEKWLMILAGRRTLAEFWIQLRLRRLQSFVNTRFEEGKTLLRTLGFKFEGNMPQYFENGDAAERWAICRGQ